MKSAVTALIQPPWDVRPLPVLTQPLIGKYVRVDPFCDDDVPGLWKALGGDADSVNRRLYWYGLNPLENEQDLAKLLHNFQAPPYDSVNIFRLLHPPHHQEESVIAGMASYIATSPDNGTTEVGYVAHGASLTRTRAATEAHFLLARHVLEDLGYRRYEWKCDAGNEASKQAALRYGFTAEGLFRQHRVRADGKNRDTQWFSMLDSEWPQRKAAFEAWLDPENFDSEGQQKVKLQVFQDRFQ